MVQRYGTKIVNLFHHEQTAHLYSANLSFIFQITIQISNLTHILCERSAMFAKSSSILFHNQCHHSSILQSDIHLKNQKEESDPEKCASTKSTILTLNIEANW
jgi:hypothetical protein